MADQEPSGGKVVSIPGFGDVLIPDELSPTAKQRFEAEARDRYKKAPADQKPDGGSPVSWLDTAVEWLPNVEGAIGGYMGGPAGAAVGGASGRGHAELIKHASELPGALVDTAKGLVSHPVETVKGFVQGASGGVVDAGKDAAKQAAYAGAGKLVKMASPAIGRVMESAGNIAQDVGASNLERVATGAEILRGLFTGGGLKGAALKLAIPAATRVGGRMVSATGRALQAVGSEAAPAALSASERAAQIPLRERLAQIPLQDVTEAWQAAKAATPNASIADDVSMVRALVSQGFNQETAIKIASGGSKDAAAAVKAGWMQSLKAKGAPIPEAAMKSSGKVPSAVSELMDSPTFKALAESVAQRAK